MGLVKKLTAFALPDLEKSVAFFGNGIPAGTYFLDCGRYLLLELFAGTVNCVGYIFTQFLDFSAGPFKGLPVVSRTTGLLQ